MSRVAFCSFLASVALLGVWIANPAEITAQPRDSEQRDSENTSQERPGRSGKAAPNKAPQKARPIAVTPERVAAVMTFVQRNHSELADLLEHLKANQPREYEQAIRDLHRVTERLAQIQERDPVHYELEVAYWTSQSKVQLLSAQLKMADDDEIRGQLRDALSNQMDARLAVLRHERQRSADRLAKMDREISRLETERQILIERQLQTLTRTVTEPRAKLKSTGSKSTGAASTSVKTKKKPVQ